MRKQIVIILCLFMIMEITGCNNRGYTYIYEFGGIIDWTGETVSE